MTAQENRRYGINGASPSEIKQYLEYGDRVEIPLHNLEHVLREFDKLEYNFFALAIHNGKCSLMLANDENTK